MTEVVRNAVPAIPSQSGARDETEHSVIKGDDLSIHVDPRIVDVLDRLCHAKHIDRKEGIRRAVALWNYLESEQKAGRRLAVVDRGKRRETISELELT